MKDNLANASPTSGARLAEFRFLCAVINESAGTQQRPNPADVSDWSRLLRTADGLAVLPALYSGLQRLEFAAAVPDPQLEHMAAAYELNRDRNLRLVSQVTEFVPVLAEKSIKTVLLKGAAALASGLYRDPGSRLLSDIDVMVNADDLEATAEAFYQLGYRFMLPGSGGYSPATIEAGLRYETYHHDLAGLMHPDYPAAIEVHRHSGSPASRRLLSGDTILRDAVSVRYDDVDMLVPSIRHRIIHNFNHCQIQNLNHRYITTMPRDLYDFVLQLDDAGSSAIQDEIQTQMAQSDVATEFSTFLYRARYFFGLHLTSEIKPWSLPWWHLRVGILFIRAPPVARLFRTLVAAVFFPVKLCPSQVLWRNPGMSLPVAYAVSFERLLRRMGLKRSL